jgi:hypothetical protein
MGLTIGWMMTDSLQRMWKKSVFGITCHFIRKTEKHHGNLQKIRSPCRYLNSGLSKYKTGLLRTAKWYPVKRCAILLDTSKLSTAQLIFSLKLTIPWPFKTRRLTNYSTIYTTTNTLVTHNGCYIITQGSNLYVINSSNLKYVPL